MSKRIVTTLAAILSALSSGCAHEISSEERLERETARSQALATSTAEELSALKCDDINAALTRARDPESAGDEEGRVNTYIDLYLKVKERTQRFDEALTRNPDLAYQEGSEDITGARDVCVQSESDVRFDLETLVREILQMPVVDAVKGGATVKVARMPFEVLRDAIETLNLDDRDSLFTRLSNAERQLETTPTPASTKPRRRR